MSYGELTDLRKNFSFLQRFLLGSKLKKYSSITAPKGARVDVMFPSRALASTFVFLNPFLIHTVSILAVAPLKGLAVMVISVIFSHFYIQLIWNLGYQSLKTIFALEMVNNKHARVWKNVMRVMKRR